MTNFVTLCQRVRQECGLSGDGPTSTIGQTGILKKVVDRTARAWVDIQTAQQYWSFLRRQLSFPLVVDQSSYVISEDTPTGFGLTTMDKWDVNASFIYKTSTDDESSIDWIEYPLFRQSYRTLESGRPSQACMGPLGTVKFNRTPDYAYTITFDYWKTPELMQNPTDIPSLPAQYIDVIVWKSVMMFAGNEMAPDLFTYATRMYNQQMLKLVVDQCEVPLKNRSYPLAMGGQRAPRPFENAQ
jgi:hypothetical protein